MSIYRFIRHFNSLRFAGISSVLSVALLVGGLSPAYAADASEDHESVPATEAAQPENQDDLTAPDAFSAQIQARLTKKKVEDLSQRTAMGSVFALPDGQWQQAIASGPVWVKKGGDGTSAEDWAPVNENLQLL